MAQHVLSTSLFKVNTVDLTDHLKSITVNLRKDQIDDTAFNDGAHSFMAGLQNNEISVVLQQDYDSSKTDATLWGVWNGGTAVAITWAATSSTLSATNPEYEMSAQLLEYTPISGGPGDEALVNATFLATSVVTRDVTAD